jgi:hypothetical protein
MSANTKIIEHYQTEAKTKMFRTYFTGLSVRNSEYITGINFVFSKKHLPPEVFSLDIYMANDCFDKINKIPPVHNYLDEIISKDMLGVVNKYLLRTRRAYSYLTTLYVSNMDTARGIYTFPLPTPIIVKHSEDWYQKLLFIIEYTDSCFGSYFSFTVKSQCGDSQEESS